MQETGNSLHRGLVASAGEDLVSDDDFLLTAPPVLVAPDIAPVHEVGHREHADAEAAHEGLSADHWEEQESARRREQPVLKAAQLILLEPVLVRLQVRLRLVADVAVVNQPVDELALLFPAGPMLKRAFLVEGLLRLDQNVRPGVDLEDPLDFLLGVPARVQIANHFVCLFSFIINYFFN